MSDEHTETKAAGKRRYRGIVDIDIELCKGCGFCVEFCPSQALALSPKFNSRGYHPAVLVNEEACTGAGLCSALCPDFAIFARREKVEPDKETS